MSTTNIKPTPEEIDHAKQIYKDVNDYLDYLADIIQTHVQEYEEYEEYEDSDDDDEEFSPAVSQFLNEYKEYISSRPQIHNQLVNSDSSSSSSTRKRLWRYSQPLPPNLIGDLKKLFDAKLDRSVQASPSFSTSLPTLDINGNNEKLLTNETSPSVTLLKAQLEKYAKEEQEKNRIVIRVPKYSYDEPIEEERKVVFVVKKSTAVIVAPPTIVEPPKEQERIKEEEKGSTIEDEKSEVVEISEKISEKYVKKNTIDFDFLSKFLSITKVGFSKSQLSSLVWT